MDKLIEIMAWKRQEIADRIRDVSEAELEAIARETAGHPSFFQALSKPDYLSVIAEIKRRSPSAGAIREGADANQQADVYSSAGADALSILTDTRYFGGSLDDLTGVTSRFREKGIEVPCLRKDFMVHPIQVLEAARVGASAILLIVRALTDDELLRLRDAANLAGLDALFEIHSEPELERALRADARIIGVNNRDLTIFKTDLTLSERLIPQIPSGSVAVSESGIFTGDDARRMRAAGAHAVLIGEALMKAPDPAVLLADFHRA